MVGIAYNALESNNAVDIQGTIRTPIAYKRTWDLQYQPSLMLGVAFKSQVWRKMATQIEVNLLSTRQKATIDEAKSVNNNQTATVGTIQFSTLYLHIPIVMRFKIEEASDVELGVIQMFALQNWGREDLTKTIFTEQANVSNPIINNNPITTFSPPKVVEIFKKPDLFKNNHGFLVGVNYRINPKTSVRLRYERELYSFSRYSDLSQSRLLLNVLFKWK